MQISWESCVSTALSSTHAAFDSTTAAHRTGSLDDRQPGSRPSAVARVQSRGHGERFSVVPRCGAGNVRPAARSRTQLYQPQRVCHVSFHSRSSIDSSAQALGVLLIVYATLIIQDLRREAVGRSVLRAGDRVGTSCAGGVSEHRLPGLSSD